MGKNIIIIPKMFTYVVNAQIIKKDVNMQILIQIIDST